MVDTKHAEAIDTGITAFDQIVQDITEIREKQNLRSAPHRRARSAETDIAPEESLPLFLAPHDGGYPDSRDQDIRLQRAGYRDAPADDIWLRDALETDREDMEPDAGPSVLKRVFKAGIAAASLVAVLAALFALRDHRGLILDASASLAAVLPGFASADPPAPAAPVAVAPTREAIAAAYQTARQIQPEIRQPPAAPAPAPAARRLDPDERAGLLKRAEGLLVTGDLVGARLLLERAADAHEAKAAFLLAQTYDPAVLGVSDTRSVTPDPEAARSWYGKAVAFGSQEARQRLAQMN